ncbi:MAG: efflux RND transporter periplasmic adaptor subunit [Acidobacteria bacterium]|nr:efflux RND transporter periplasmic adaptor subunit [Acidobacteriota bacterium]
MLFGYYFMNVKVCTSLTILLAIAFGLSCSSSRAGNDTGGAKKGTEEKKVIAVTIGKSVAREVPAYIQASGSLVADETSDIAPKVAGKITNVYANVGEFVGGGKIIARIDDRDARLRLAEAEANVKQSRAAVRQAEARLGLSPNGKFNSSVIPEVRVANANYEQVLAELKQAEANEKRYRDLVESGDVSMATYEQYRTNRDTARARLNASKQALEAAVNTAKQSNQAIKSAEAAVESAQTQVATARQALVDTVIRAPFPGFISERKAAVGEFVTSSTPIATLLRTNPIKIQIQIAEADVPQVAIGRGVSIEVDAYKNRRFTGVVTAVNPAIDPTSRAATVEAQIENSDNSLRSGMFATARITREGGTTGVFVPKSAIFNDQATQSYRVFVIEKNVAKLKVVQLGLEEDDFYQILSGVEADQPVATSGLDKLYEGANVSF